MIKKQKIIISGISTVLLAGGVFVGMLAFYPRAEERTKPENVASSPTTSPVKQRIIREESSQEPPEESDREQEDDTELANNTPRHEAQDTALPPEKPETVTLHTDEGEQEFPNRMYRALYTPNDYKNQWHTDMIKAPAAWDTSVGSSDTVVAVLDTGFALEHDELFSRWAINTAETQDNQTDDDANGFVDDWRGWDFYNGDNAPQTGTNNPTGKAVGHGTEVAGLVGAAGNNSLGVAGVNWHTDILPLQVLNDAGDGFTSDIAAAIDYAVDQDVDIISMSLGGEDEDPVLEAAIDRAIANDILVVAASGNDGCNCMLFPARYSPVLSVGASTVQDTVASFSSFGPTLDMVAPGANISQSPTWRAGNPQNAYKISLSGTSYATPIVSGAAAMLRGADTEMTAQETVQTILDTSEISASLVESTNIRYGAGRVDLFAALSAVIPDEPVAQPQAYTPLYRVFKSGKDDEYTVLPEQMWEWRNDGYQYEIERFIPIDQ